MGLAKLLISGCNRPTNYFASSNSPGVSLFHVDFASRTASLQSQLATIDNPVFLLTHPGSQRVYVTSEMPSIPEGSVTAIDVGKDDNLFKSLATQSSAGSITCYLSLDQTGRFLLVANHGWDKDLGGRDQAVAVVALDDVEGLGNIVASVQQTGSGPQLPRQQRSHPHAVLATPDNRFLVVTDLGTDSLLVYTFDESDGSIDLKHTVQLEPETGPRHFVFADSGSRIYVSGELDSSVTGLTMDAEGGTLEIIGKCSTLPEGHFQQNHPSEIALSPSGTHLYVANRGNNTIARIAVNGADGKPEFVDAVDCQGDTPRHFIIDPSGKYVVVANQDSDRVNFFTVDDNDRLSPMDFSINLGTPTCVAFLT